MAALRKQRDPGGEAFERTAAEEVVDAAQAQEWDRFVSATPGGDLVQTSIWGQSKRALGFDTRLVVSRDRGEILGGALIVIKRFGPLGGVGYIARGPLLKREHPSALSQLIDEIERVARGRQVGHLIIQPPERGDAVVVELAARGYTPGAPEVAPTATIRIDLSESLDQILARMPQSKRSKLRRAQRRGVVTRPGGRGDIDLFHRLHEATARRQGFPALSRSYLYHQWDELNGSGSVHLVFAFHEDRPLAAIWLAGFGDMVSYRLPGWAGERPDLSPNDACHWSAIQWAKKNGYLFYDLGGIDRRFAQLMLAGQPIPPELSESRHKFKKEFGGDVLVLPIPSQRTFNPVARLLIRSAARFARSKPTKWLSHRLRNG